MRDPPLFASFQSGSPTRPKRPLILELEEDSPSCQWWFCRTLSYFPELCLFPDQRNLAYLSIASHEWLHTAPLVLNTAHTEISTSRLSQPHNSTYKTYTASFINNWLAAYQCFLKFSNITLSILYSYLFSQQSHTSSKFYSSSMSSILF